MNDPRIPHDSAKDRHCHPRPDPQQAPDCTTTRLPLGGPSSDTPSPHAANGVHDAGGRDGYSATALGSHWFERPDSPPAPDTATRVCTRQPTSAAPDRVEGEVLRFGPGVTAVLQRQLRNHDNPVTTAAALWHGNPPRQQPRQQRRGLRRYALAATVLLAVLAYLTWQRHGPALAVTTVTLHTTTQEPDCDSTTDVTGLVTTNGQPGTLTYRWTRSDGTSSGLLREKLTHGQKQARLHLLWTLHGRGTYEARAQLHILTPSSHTATTHLTYHCS